MIDPAVSLLLGLPAGAPDTSALPATAMSRLAKALGLDFGKLAALLKLSPATVSRRRRDLRPLPAEASALLLGVARMVVDLQTIVEKSGDHSGSDAGAWLGRWLTRPLPALGWRQPADWLGTVEDQQVVSDMLGRIASQRVV